MSFLSAISHKDVLSRIAQSSLRTPPLSTIFVQQPVYDKQTNDLMCTLGDEF